MIPAATVPVPASSRMSRPGLVLLAGLLVMRLPFLVYAYLTKLPTYADIYYTGTYWLTLLLIWVERKRLQEYHIGPTAVALVALGPVVDQVVYRMAKASAVTQLALPTRWLEIVPGLLLLCALALRGFPKPFEGKRIWLWIAAAVPVGLVTAALFGAALRHQTIQVGNQTVPFIAIVFHFTVQFTRAATYEEPLFRGFLWGVLRQRHWSDLYAWLLQAGLFLVGHFYYFPRYPISLLLIVPVLGLLVGFLAWRSRSIVPGMFVHGISNGLSNFFANGTWL